MWNLELASMDLKIKKKGPKKEYDRLLKFVTGRKTRGEGPQTYLRGTLERFVWERYEQQLRRNCMMDFNDILWNTRYLLEERSDIRDMVQEKFRYG